MILADMRQLLLDTLEVEDEDWPQPLMDAAIAEGHSAVLAANPQWPWLEGRWDVMVPGGSNVIDLAQSGDTIRDVVSVRCAGRKLRATDEDQALAQYGGRTGNPEVWSRWASQVNLWPTPTGDTLVQVHGYREPRPFVSLGGWEPDLPESMQPLLMDWALANEYQRQEDTEMMAAYRQKFDVQLRVLKNQVLATPPPMPLIVGGDGAHIRGR